MKDLWSSEQVLLMRVEFMAEHDTLVNPLLVMACSQVEHFHLSSSLDEAVGHEYMFAHTVFIAVVMRKST